MLPSTCARAPHRGQGAYSARLAGALELLAWSELGPAGPPGQLGAEQIERGVRLWSEHFRPHAFALFHRLVPSESERRARRVVRWLRQSGVGEVSREQVRGGGPALLRQRLGHRAGPPSPAGRR